MTDRIRETAAQVAAMIPRFSWEIMTEEQRDVLVREVILPRYGKVTTDGTTLGPSWWGSTLGCTPATIEGRVGRLRRSEAQEVPALALPSASDKSSVRGTRSVLKHHPELAADLLKDPAVMEIVKAAVRTKSDNPSPPKSLDDKVEGAINTIVQALLKRDAGEWEPNNWTLGKLHFVARWIIGEVEAPEDTETFVNEATSEDFVNEVYAYLQEADRR